MTTLPIAPVSLPADLAGQSNGKLDDSLLVTVQAKGRLHHLAARAWFALEDAARREAGLPLTFTFGGTYRTYASQETLFRSRYVVGGAGGGCKTWNGQLWCKKSSNLATAAVPGTSNHGWGLAVDTAYDNDESDGIGPDDATAITAHPGWRWLLANAARFGWSWELQSEPWHIRYVAGDAIPQAVLDFEAPPTPTPPTEEDEDMAKIAYYLLPPVGYPAGSPEFVVVDASIRYRTNADRPGLLPDERVPAEQYDNLRKSAGL